MALGGDTGCIRGVDCGNVARAEPSTVSTVSTRDETPALQSKHAKGALATPPRRTIPGRPRRVASRGPESSRVRASLYSGSGWPWRQAPGAFGMLASGMRMPTRVQAAAFRKEDPEVRAVVRLLPVLLVCAGCAHVPVNENLTLFQGDPIENVRGVTFDGEAFEVPGAGAIARDDVTLLLFQPAGAEDGATAAAEGVAGLTKLAQEMLPEGQALAEQFPGTGGVILVDDGLFVYNDDGTHRYRYHFAGLVLKEEMKSWAQFAAGFTEGRSRVRVLEAKSIAPDGTVYTLPAEALRVGSPSEEMEFFNPSHKVVGGVIPGVEIGSIIEYIYEYDNYNPEDPRLFLPGYYFQSTEPVALSRVTVEIPDSLPFRHYTRHFPDPALSEPQVEREGKRVRYVWALRDMPPLVPEPQMPPQPDLTPRMEASIFSSFEEVYALQRDLQRSRMKLTPQIQAEVARITEGAETIDEKLARIYHWVQTNTRYISIKGSLGSGLSGHTAMETFENRYGDCTDKAILFATMCEAIGVTSYPIILSTNDNGVGVTEIPTIDGNHAISEVELPDGRRFYLDSTAQNFRYPYFRADDHGCIAVNAIRGDFNTIPVPPPEDNARHSVLEAELAASGDMTVRTRNEYTGTIEAGIRAFWKTVRDDERAYRMTEYVNSLSPGALLDDFTLSELADLNEPVRMGIDYRLPGHAIRAGKLMYLRMPSLERTFPEVALESRRFPIQYMTTEERTLSVHLTLPAGFRLKWAPPPLRIRTPHLEYDAVYEETATGVALKEVFRRLDRIIPVEAYAEYRDALRAIAAFTAKEIFVTEEG